MVVDHVGKLEKHASSSLAADDAFEAGIPVQSAGAFGRRVAFCAVGLIGSLFAGGARGGGRRPCRAPMRAGSPRPSPPGTSCSASPPGRFLVFEANMPGNPGELLMEMPLSDLHEAALDKRRAHYAVPLRFFDGSVRDLDAVKMAGPDRFGAALDRPKGRA
jgi:hypothetical protein